MSNYFRITGYYPAKDICFIADSNGKFQELWQFSSYLVCKGVKIIEVGKADTFQDGDMPKVTPDTACIILRACDRGQPLINGNAITVKGRTYTSLKRS